MTFFNLTETNGNKKMSVKQGHFHCLPLFTVSGSGKNWKRPGLGVKTIIRTNNQEGRI